MNVTASSLSRFAKCPASAVLTHVNSSNEYAERGSSGHAYLESCARGLPREMALKNVEPEYLKLCESVDIEELFRDSVEKCAETALAVNFETGKARLIGHSVGRNYGELAPWEVAGSADLLAKRRMDSLTQVTDYKFGDAPEASDNLQLMFFAAALHLLEGVDEVELRIAYINAEDPGMGQVRWSKYVATVFDIDAFMALMKRSIKEALEQEKRLKETGTVSVKVGDWCRYCSAKTAGVCPAYAGLARTMVSDMTDIRSALSSLSPEQLGSAWLKYKQAKQIVEEIEKGLKEIAKDAYEQGAPIPVGDDKVISLVKKSKSYLDANALMKLAEAHGAGAEEIAACYKTTTYSEYRTVRKDK